MAIDRELLDRLIAGRDLNVVFTKDGVARRSEEGAFGVHSKH